MQNDHSAIPDHDTIAVHRSRRATAPRPGDTSSPQAPAATRRNRHRRVGLLAGALVALLFATGCNAIPLAQWVPDFNHDGTISQDEVRWQQAVLANQLDAQRRAVQNHPFLTCVRNHESGGNYQAQNPSSSASGAYQFLDSTWRTVSSRAGPGGYSRAAYAPWYTQDAVALWMYQNGGRSAWNGTGC